MAPSTVEQAVSLMNVLDGLITETATAQTDEVDAAVAGWLLAGNDVWRTDTLGIYITFL